MLVISWASLPSTATGKKYSMRVAASAPPPSSSAAARAPIPIVLFIRNPLLSFDAGEHEAVDELPLEGEERHDQRRRDEKRPGSDEPPFVPTLRPGGEAREPDRQGAPLGRVDHHQRPQELVPVRGDRDDGEGDEAGLRQRQEHMAEKLPEPGAVDE